MIIKTANKNFVFRGIEEFDFPGIQRIHLEYYIVPTKIEVIETRKHIGFCLKIKKRRINKDFLH